MCLCQIFRLYLEFLGHSFSSANNHAHYLTTELSMNPLMGTLKLQGSGPLYRNTVIGTMTVNCYIWYSEEGPGPNNSLYQM